MIVRERWGKAIRELLEGPSPREDLGGKGLENIKRFTWHLSAGAHGEVVAEVPG
jgi:hypothetical protein